VALNQEPEVGMGPLPDERGKGGSHSDERHGQKGRRGGKMRQEELSKKYGGDKNERNLRWEFFFGGGKKNMLWGSRGGPLPIWRARERHGEKGRVPRGGRGLFHCERGSSSAKRLEYSAWQKKRKDSPYLGLHKPDLTYKTGKGDGLWEGLGGGKKVSEST